MALRQRSRGEPIPAGGLVDPDATRPASVDLRAVLDEELSRLPEKYRVPVVLCYLEGRTQEEAARTLGWTKGTVSGRLARAKDLLRQRLTRRGLAPSAGLLAAAMTAETARAAVPASLVLPTVRVASAAILGRRGHRPGHGPDGLPGQGGDEAHHAGEAREDRGPGLRARARDRRPRHHVDTVR